MNSRGDRNCVLAGGSAVISCSNTAPNISSTTRTPTEDPFGDAAMNISTIPSVAMLKLARISVSAGAPTPSFVTASGCASLAGSLCRCNSRQWPASASSPARRWNPRITRKPALCLQESLVLRSIRLGTERPLMEAPINRSTGSLGPNTTSPSQRAESRLMRLRNANMSDGSVLVARYQGSLAPINCRTIGFGKRRSSVTA